MNWYPGSFPAGAVNSATAFGVSLLFEATYLGDGYDESRTNTNAYTFTDVPIGATDADRYVVATVVANNGGVDRTLSSLTCNGSAMTVIGGAGLAADAVEIAVAYLKVPSGTTATFVATWNDTMGECTILVHTIVSASGTITVAASDFETASAASVSAIKGDFILGACVEDLDDGGALMSWTGSTASTVGGGDALDYKFAYEEVGASVTRTQAAVPSSGDSGSYMVVFRQS